MGRLRRLGLDFAVVGMEAVAQHLVGQHGQGEAVVVRLPVEAAVAHLVRLRAFGATGEAALFTVRQEVLDFRRLVIVASDAATVAATGRLERVGVQDQDVAVGPDQQVLFVDVAHDVAGLVQAFH